MVRDRSAVVPLGSIYRYECERGHAFTLESAARSVLKLPAVLVGLFFFRVMFVQAVRLHDAGKPVPAAILTFGALGAVAAVLIATQLAMRLRARLKSRS